MIAQYILFLLYPLILIIFFYIQLLLIEYQYFLHLLHQLILAYLINNKIQQYKNSLKIIKDAINNNIKIYKFISSIKFIYQYISSSFWKITKIIMIASIPPILIFVSLIFLNIAMYTQTILYFLLINVGVTSLYIIRKIIISPSSTDYFLTHGEVLFNYFYTVWLFYLNKNQYIYYSPIIISIATKLYQFFDKNKNFNQSILQHLILFQAKCQFIVILFFLCQNLMMLFTFNTTLKYSFLLLALIIAFRLKYEKNYATQKAINQIHLSIDGISKTLGCRVNYQQVYQIITQIFKVSQTYQGKKVISY